MRNFNKISLKGKRVILRVDLNIPMEGNKILNYARIERIKPTIDFLKKNGAKIILISHFGRPGGKHDKNLSLKMIIGALENIFETPIKFAPQVIAKENLLLSNEINEGEILLLENLRFVKEEESNAPSFAKELATYGDIYINEAFSCSHRAHASVCAITDFLPAYPGLLLQEELNSLGAIIDKNNKPIMVIIGGKKVSTKFPVLNNLIKFTDYLVIGGAMANTFLKAEGMDIGSSFYEAELIPAVKAFISKYKDKIILPCDYIVAKLVNNKYTPSKVCDGAFENDDVILDAGPKSIIEFSNIMAKCKMVLWNGPLGFYEDERFANGTLSFAKVIAHQTKKGEIKSIIGGGDIVACIEKGGLFNTFSYVSTAGGAFLEWLEGKELPGIKCLIKNATLNFN